MSSDLTMTQVRTVEYAAFRWRRLVPIFAGLMAIDLVLYQLYYYLWDAITLGLELGFLKSLFTASQEASEIILSCGHEQMAKFYSDLILFNIFVVTVINQFIIVYLDKSFSFYKLKIKAWWPATTWVSSVMALVGITFTFIAFAHFLSEQCADYSDVNLGNMWALAFLTVWLSFLANSLARNVGNLGNAR